MFLTSLHSTSSHTPLTMACQYCGDSQLPTEQTNALQGSFTVCQTCEIPLFCTQSCYDSGKELHQKYCDGLKHENYPQIMRTIIARVQPSDAFKHYLDRLNEQDKFFIEVDGKQVSLKDVSSFPKQQVPEKKYQQLCALVKANFEALVVLYRDKNGVHICKIGSVDLTPSPTDEIRKTQKEEVASLTEDDYLKKSIQCEEWMFDFDRGEPYRGSDEKYRVAQQKEAEFSSLKELEDKIEACWTAIWNLYKDDSEAAIDEPHLVLGLFLREYQQRLGISDEMRKGVCRSPQQKARLKKFVHYFQSIPIKGSDELNCILTLQEKYGTELEYSVYERNLFSSMEYIIISVED